jgi:hypothetical protein
VGEMVLFRKKDSRFLAESAIRMLGFAKNAAELDGTLKNKKIAISVENIIIE